MASFGQISILFGIALEILLALLLIKRGLQRRLSVFFIYIVVEIFNTAIRFSTVSHHSIYFRVYWPGELLSVSLALFSSYVSFIRAFRGLNVLFWFRAVVIASISLALVWSAWNSVFHPPVRTGIPHHIYALMQCIVGLQTASHYILICTVVLSVVIRYWLNLDKKNIDLGIIYGFGASALGVLVGAAAFSEFRTKLIFVSEWSGAVGYYLALFIWLFFFIPLMKNYTLHTDVQNTFVPHRALQQLKQYRTVLKRKV